MKVSLILLMVVSPVFAQGSERTDPTKAPRNSVTIVTNVGTIVVQLYPKKAPLTVKNFLAYAESGFYKGTIFHRVIPGFVIQGGGLTAEMKKKPTLPPIKNEANNGLSNKRGTLAVARAAAPDSGTCQFFINLKNNPTLDFSPKNRATAGYCVFGKVVKGMDIVDRIAKVKTGNSGAYRDVPVEPIVISNIRIRK